MATPINNDDQKKRTRDGLELRFKQAEAEIRSQQQKGQKRPLEPKAKPKLDNKSPSKVPLTFPSTNPAIKDSDLNNYAYCQLLYPVNENLATVDKSDDPPNSTVDYILNEHLKHGDAASKYLQGSKRREYDDCILLDNFVPRGGMSASDKAQARAIKRQAKRSKKRASLKQHKRLGSFDLPTEYHNFERFRPLHEMWKTYISQMVKNIGKNQVEKCLLKADLHGAMVLVAHCKVSAFSGVRGIIVRETAETFGIITQDNKFRVVPKKLSVFMLQADSWKVTLHGDKLSQEREA